MERDKRCGLCGDPVVLGRYCLKHGVEHRERVRERLGLKRRFYGALSYRLEAKARAAARRKLSERAK
jgi:hypothetical protein